MDYTKEIAQIWSMVLELIKPHYSEASYTLWFADIIPIDLTDKKFVLSTTTAFKRNIISSRHRDIIEQSLKEVLGYYIEIALLTEEEAQTYIDRGVISENAVAEDKSSAPITPPVSLNEYNFDNFIVGSSNTFAHAACLAVAKSPATAYNPLFIWGPPGIGKTHLMYAIKNELIKNDPTCNCIYVKGEDFTNQVVDAIMKQNTHAFREKYRTVDVLIIDDIQFIAGKISTQEEFFHTFDALYTGNKQIVITSDKPPKEMKTLEDRLKSRFESGLIADIQSPDIELRMAIIKNKAAKMNITIPNDVITYMADRMKNNVRQIEGSLKKLTATALLAGTPITLEVAKGALSDIASDREPSNVTVDKIFTAVSLKYQIPKEDIKSRRQTGEVVNARHICIYLIRSLTDLTLSQVGGLFSRDHTTAMSSFRKIEKKISSDPSFEAEMNELISDVKES